MSYNAHVGFDRFPMQGEFLGTRTRVVFDHSDPPLMGTIVRDDTDVPWVTIIHLDNGRYVLGTECQYSPTLKV